MDKKDEEMRDVIGRLWPIQAKKLGELLVPPKESKKTFQWKFSIYAINELMKNKKKTFDTILFPILNLLNWLDSSLV